MTLPQPYVPFFGFGTSSIWNGGGGWGAYGNFFGLDAMNDAAADSDGLGLQSFCGEHPQICLHPNVAPTATASGNSPQSGFLGLLKKVYCSLPAIGISGTAGGYEGVGGGVSGGFAFDPQSGRLGISGGLNVGVGVGFSVDGSVSGNVGGSIPNGVGGSVGVNASVRVPGRITVTLYQIPFYS